MLGVLAEFETNLRCERQLEGITKIRAAGLYGRPAHLDGGSGDARDEEFRTVGATEITKALGNRPGRASSGSWE